MIYPASFRFLRRPLSSFISNSSRAGSLSFFAIAGLLALSQPGNAAVAIVKTVVAGESDTFVVRADGSVWATGDNTYGELGDGTTVSKSTPIQVMTGVAAVSAGYGHTLFLKTDGTVWAVGKNDFGQLGDGSLVDKTTPVKVNVVAGVTAIAAGGNMSLFLGSTDTGLAYACGFTGSSVTPTRTTPTQVTNSVTAIAAGGGTSYYRQTGINNGHGLFLRSNGSVLAFGDNDFGQLGDGSQNPVTRSALGSVLNTTGTGPLIGVTAIAAGAEHSLFLIPNGNAFSALSAGSNEFGQLGFIDPGSYPGATNFYFYSTPKQYFTGDVVGVAAGGFHTFTVQSGGVVLATGRDDQGQLGDGHQVNRFFGAQVLSGVSRLAAGGRHSIFLKTTSNDILTTGANDQGQLGNGLTTGTLVPTSIGNLTQASQTITFPSPGNQVLSSPVVPLIGTASPSDLPVTYSITSGPATVLDSTLTLTGAGPVVIKANQPGNFKYAPAQAVSRTITVAKGIQTLTFTLPATISLSSSPVTLAANSNAAGLTVTYSVVSGPATVSGSTLTLTGTGAVTVRASQEGDGNWLAASDADATFTATPAAGIEAWAAAAGLTGDDALATAIPFHDGVTNLAKYSFNMNGAAADNSLMTTAGSSGLPLVELDRSGADPVLRVTFVRRKGTTLVYTAQRSGDLAGFAAIAATPEVTSIDDTWERVIVSETISTSTTPTGFARVQVELP